MNDSDKILSQYLDAGTIRPRTGHLLCEKITEGKSLEIEGIGVVNGTVTPGGLVIVGAHSEGEEAIRSKLLVVRAMGATPRSWKFRFFSKERDWGTNWAEQNIEVGTVIAVRSVAGVEQDVDSLFLEVRYDEICAVGQPEGTGGLDMLPAPGWVAVELDRHPETIGGLHIRGEAVDVLTNGQIEWGTVVGLPAGYSDEGLKVGDRVGWDRYRYQEFMMAGGLRFMPLDEVLVVQDAQ